MSGYNVVTGCGGGYNSKWQHNFMWLPNLMGSLEECCLLSGDTSSAEAALPPGPLLN